MSSRSVRLTHAAATEMFQRGKGGILNVSSLAGFQPGPANATYSATKAFITSFTEAVHEELKGSGVNVTVLCPGFTRTGFQEVANAPAESIPGFVWQEADEVARAGLDALAKNKAVAIPGNLNKVLGNFSAVMPSAITRRLGAAVLKRSGFLAPSTVSSPRAGRSFRPAQRGRARQCRLGRTSSADSR